MLLTRPAVTSSGFLECAAVLRHRPGPARPDLSLSVIASVSAAPISTADLPASAGPDPRLAGRALRRVAFSEAQIAARVRELGREITTAYPEGDLLVLGLLKGSFIFLSDLVREIARPLHVDFLVASSYGDDTVSSGTVRLLYDPETTLAGKHILLVEDIVDSGRTLQRLVALLGERGPRSLEICALLHKHIATHLEHPVRFVGFDAPEEFLVGYGLDHAEHFRHVPYVASLQ